MRTMGFLGMAVVAALGLSSVACSGKVKLAAKVETPKPEAPKDTDGDGITDDVDKCVNEKEDGLPPDPKDGCPSDDPDNDGIKGAADKCPTEPETVNGHEDEDGCPDKKPRVQVTAKAVVINEKIQFEFGKAEVNKASFDLLNEVAKVINDNPQIEFLEVAGHADSVGGDAQNLLLTKGRSNAVMTYLVGKGVMKSRMRAAGYGEHCPLDPADTDAAREKNRRVEFHIMRLDGKDTDVKLGCEEAEKKGIKPKGVPATAPKKADIEKAGKKDDKGGKKKLTDKVEDAKK